MLKTWIDAHMDEQIEDLKGLLRIPSVSRGEPEEGMPFGRNVYNALDYTLKLANRMGFDRTKMVGGACATVEFGEGEEMLMVMAHLDVVPAGSGWNSDPFEPVIKNGRLIARGVEDDKSPAISALYAMAAIKEAGLPMKRRVRLFLGGDEERGCSCVERYKQTEELPTMAFTPDACYPLVNSEMGILHVTYARSHSDSGIRIDCGTAANVVPGEAEVTLPNPAIPCEVPEGFTAEFEGNTIRVHGFGGHAANNEKAKNALLCLLKLLAEQDLPAADYTAAATLHAILGFDLHGEGFGVDTTDESGRITVSPDILKWDENGISLTIDSRYPFSLPVETLLEKMDTVLAVLGFERTKTSNNKGHFIPRDSELVSQLLSVYEKQVGHKAEPLSIGGGTYARGFENAVAFGIEREGSMGECHMPNESMSLEDIRFNTHMFAEAIKALAVSE